jgi:hypothetical protein
MSTTTYDAENNILDSSQIKKAQRWLTKEGADNQAKYKLVMMADVDGIMKPENFNPEQRGQVLLVVPIGSNPTPENILDLALKYDNEVVPLYFEAPLTSDVSTNSFFGNQQVNKFSRDKSVHQERIEKLAALTDKTPQQIQAEYEQEFKKLQELRKQPFTVLNITAVSKGFRVPNDNTFIRLPQEYHTPVLDTNTETGILTATYYVQGQKVDLEVFGKPLTEGEIDYLVENLDIVHNFKHSKREEVKAVFELILGTKIPRANSFFFKASGVLHFNKDKVSKAVTTKEEFRKLNKEGWGIYASVNDFYATSEEIKKAGVKTMRNIQFLKK